MVSALILNIFRHQKKCNYGPRYGNEGKNTIEKLLTNYMGNFLSTHVFINNQTMFSF